MDNCKHCGTDLIHVPGRKKKDFCNVNCRNKWFYAERKRLLAEALKSMVQLPPDYVNVKKVGILTKDGEVKPLVLPKPKINNEAILSQIAAIKAEKVPKERDTLNGRKSWQIDQNKRIIELQDKLNHE